MGLLFLFGQPPPWAPCGRPWWQPALTRCRCSAPGAAAGTTVVDLRDKPFCGPVASALAALVAVGTGRARSRRVVLVGDHKRFGERLVEAGWKFESDIVAVCSAALGGGDLEVFSRDPVTLQLLSVDGVRLLHLGKRENAEWYEFEEVLVTRQHLEETFPGIAPDMVPDAMALCMLSQFGARRASRKLRGTTGLPALIKDIEVRRKPPDRAESRRILAHAKNLLARKERLTISRTAPQTLNLGGALEEEVVERTHQQLANIGLHLGSSHQGRGGAPSSLEDSRRQDPGSGLRTSVVDRHDELAEPDSGVDRSAAGFAVGTQSTEGAQDQGRSAARSDPLGAAARPAPKDLYLVDAYNLIFRAWHSFARSGLASDRRSSSGLLMFFLKSLVKLVEDRAGRDSPVVLVFDGRYLSEGACHRKLLFPEYKGGRPEMPEEIKQAVGHTQLLADAVGLTVVEVPGLEADDVIASLTRIARERGTRSWILSSDKDFQQLLDGEAVHILKPGNGGEPLSVLTEQDFRNKHSGLSPRQQVDMRAMEGDKSDNLPGLPGFGPKTVTKLMLEYGSLEEVLARAPKEEKPSKRLAQVLSENEQLARNMKLVMELSQDLEEVDDAVFDEVARRRSTTWTKIRSVFNTLSISTFQLDRLRSKNLLDLSDPAEEEPGPGDDANEGTLTGLAALVSAEALEEMAASSGVLAVFTSAAAGSGQSALSVPGGGSCFLDAGDQGLDRILGAYLERDDGLLVGWDLKRLLKWCPVDAARKPRCQLVDLGVAAYLLDPDTPMDMMTHAELAVGRPAGRAVELRNAQDFADVALAAASALPETLKWVTAADMLPLAQLEFALVPVLANMERQGILVDSAALGDIKDELEADRTRAEERIMATDGITAFNLQSPKQLAAALQDLGADLPTTAKGNFSTSEEVLTDMLATEGLPDAVFDFVTTVLEHRFLATMVNMHLTTLEKAVRADGRIHATINQTVAATGRLSISGPNLQAVPVRHPTGRRIRRTIIAPPGFVLLSADYEQIELRILAALSGDHNMCESFRRGDDIHAITAMKIYGLADLSRVTSEQRDRAKAVNFGIPYGISAHGLAKGLKCSRPEAARTIDGYFEAFPDVSQYLESLVKSAKKTGFSTTLMSRRRHVRNIRSANAHARRAAEREAVNAPIQGSQADLIKCAMVDIAAKLRAEGLRSRMVLQIHDELLFEVDESELPQVSQMVEASMTNAIELPNEVELKVSLGAGRSWYEAKSNSKVAGGGGLDR